MTNTSILDEHMEAGELTDLPGHCKFCGEKVESEDFPMRDPDGLRDPLYFCSQGCLYKALHIFDGLTGGQLQAVEQQITLVEAANVKERH